MRDLHDKQLRLHWATVSVESGLLVQWTHELNLGIFLPPNESPACKKKKKRYRSLGIFLFSVCQQQTLKMIVSDMTIIRSGMNLAHFPHEDLPNHAEKGLMEIYIFFIVALKSCCPSDCCLCSLSPDSLVENILLILCSNSPFLFCLAW